MAKTPESKPAKADDKTKTQATATATTPSPDKAAAEKAKADEKAAADKAKADAKAAEQAKKAEEKAAKDKAKADEKAAKEKAKADAKALKEKEREEARAKKAAEKEARKNQPRQPKPWQDLPAGAEQQAPREGCVLYTVLTMIGNSPNGEGCTEAELQAAIGEKHPLRRLLRWANLNRGYGFVMVNGKVRAQAPNLRQPKVATPATPAAAN